jgi:hypothetical protein
MSGIIDYAGLYPPASLPLEQAWANFVAYQKDPYTWMLSRFVIPARRLAELTIQPGGGPYGFTALGRGGANADELLANLHRDLADIRAFRETFAGQVTVELFEVTIPASAPDVAIACIETLNAHSLIAFLETAPGEGWQNRAEQLIHALHGREQVGFKLRTGGVTPEAFPSPAQVAWALATARDGGVAIKCTAGLHHPIRHFNESVQAKMHGFLNVFGAGLLAVTNRLPESTLQAILEDEDPAHFVFDGQGFTWNGQFTVSTEEIRRARGQMVSFGSCSFEEPKEDLQALGLLSL